MKLPKNCWKKAWDLFHSSIYGRRKKPERPYCWLIVETFEDIRDESHLRNFLSILDAYGEPFKPLKWRKPGKSSPQKVDMSDFDLMLDKWKYGLGGLHMTTRPPDNPGGLLLSWIVNTRASTTAKPPNIFMTIAEHLLAEDKTRARLIKLAVELYSTFGCVHGEVRFVDYSVESPKIPEEARWNSILRSIPEVDWINFYGRPYVEMFGREKLMSAPVYKIEELPDGGLMLMLTPTLRESVSPEGRELARRVKEHLGMEYFRQPEDYNNSNNSYTQRIAPNFDTSHTPGPDEGLEFEEMDPYKEYTPDPRKFIEKVPVFVDALRKRVGELGERLDCSRSSLKVLDKYVSEAWEESTSTQFWSGKKLNREMAAYVGEVVRTEKGGEWVIGEVEDGTKVALVRVPGWKIPFDPVICACNDVLADGIYDGELFESEVGFWLDHGEPSKGFIYKAITLANQLQQKEQ